MAGDAQGHRQGDCERLQPATEGKPNAPLVRYYRADGTTAVKEGEAQYMSRYNPLTKRLRVMLYPHHETIGLFYLG